MRNDRISKEGGRTIGTSDSEVQDAIIDRTIRNTKAMRQETRNEQTKGNERKRELTRRMAEHGRVASVSQTADPQRDN